MGRALKGQFGASTGVLPGADAFDIFSSAFPPPSSSSAFAIILAVVIAIPMGYVAAKRRGSAVDNAGIVTSLVGVAIPVFFLAFLLKYFFAIKGGLSRRRGDRTASTAPG